jgi:hypothetical protein
MRHVYEIISLSFLFLLSSCAPTMKDFAKLDNDLKSTQEITRMSAAQEMGKIEDADPNVAESLIYCANNDSSGWVRSTCVKSFFSLAALKKNEDQKTLKTLKHFMESASCSEKKELYYIIAEKLPKETEKEFEALYGNCIHAYNFCEYCGQPAVGWCTMRHKFVCEQHRYFQQSGVHWRCP